MSHSNTNSKATYILKEDFDKRNYTSYYYFSNFPVFNLASLFLCNSLCNGNQQLDISNNLVFCYSTHFHILDKQHRIRAINSNYVFLLKNKHFLQNNFYYSFSFLFNIYYSDAFSIGYEVYFFKNTFKCLSNWSFSRNTISNNLKHLE